MDYQIMSNTATELLQQGSSDVTNSILQQHAPGNYGLSHLSHADLASRISAAGGGSLPFNSPIFVRPQSILPFPYGTSLPVPSVLSRSGAEDAKLAAEYQHLVQLAVDTQDAALYKAAQNQHMQQQFLQHSLALPSTSRLGDGDASHASAFLRSHELLEADAAERLNRLAYDPRFQSLLNQERLISQERRSTISPALLSACALEQLQEEQSRGQQQQQQQLLESHGRRIHALNLSAAEAALNLGGHPLPQLDSLVNSIGLPNSPCSTAEMLSSGNGEGSGDGLSQLTQHSQQRHALDSSRRVSQIDENSSGSGEHVVGLDDDRYEQQISGDLEMEGEYPDRSRSRDGGSSAYSGTSSYTHGGPLTVANSTGSGSGTRGQHKCDQCAKSFQNNSALLKHKLIHSDERKYTCDICSKGFKRLDHLNGHLNVHKSVKPFQCVVENCDKSYCDARSLRRHLEHSHGMQNPVVQSSRGLIHVRCGSATFTRPMNPHGPIILSGATSSLVGSSTSVGSGSSGTSSKGGDRSFGLQLSPHLQHPAAGLNLSLCSPGEVGLQRNGDLAHLTAAQLELFKNSPDHLAAACAIRSVNSSVITSLESIKKEMPRQRLMPPTAPAQCTQCGRIFKNVPALNGHMRLHSQGKKEKLDPAMLSASHFSSPAEIGGEQTSLVMASPMGAGEMSNHMPDGSLMATPPIAMSSGGNGGAMGLSLVVGHGDVSLHEDQQQQQQPCLQAPMVIKCERRMTSSDMQMENSIMSVVDANGSCQMAANEQQHHDYHHHQDYKPLFLVTNMNEAYQQHPHSHTHSGDSYQTSSVQHLGHHMSAPETLTIIDPHTMSSGGSEDPMIHSAPASFTYFPENYVTDPFSGANTMYKQMYTHAESAPQNLNVDQMAQEQQQPPPSYHGEVVVSGGGNVFADNQLSETALYQQQQHHPSLSVSVSNQQQQMSAGFINQFADSQQHVTADHSAAGLDLTSQQMIMEDVHQQHYNQQQQQLACLQQQQQQQLQQQMVVFQQPQVTHSMQPVSVQDSISSMAHQHHVDTSTMLQVDLNNHHEAYSHHDQMAHHQQMQQEQQHLHQALMIQHSAPPQLQMSAQQQHGGMDASAMPEHQIEHHQSLGDLSNYVPPAMNPASPMNSGQSFDASGNQCLFPGLEEPSLHHANAFGGHSGALGQDLDDDIIRNELASYNLPHLGGGAPLGGLLDFSGSYHHHQMHDTGDYLLAVDSHGLVSHHHHNQVEPTDRLELRQRHFTAPGAISSTRNPPVCASTVAAASGVFRRQSPRSTQNGSLKAARRIRSRPEALLIKAPLGGPGGMGHAVDVGHRGMRPQPGSLERKFFNLPISPVRFRRRSRNRPLPLMIPPPGVMGRFCSQLRSPKLWESADLISKVLPPYTPPPILSPMRLGSGLFWKLCRFGSISGGPKSAPISPKFGSRFWSKDEEEEEIGEVSVPEELISPQEAELEIDLPPETGTYPHINEGPDYQAVIPEFIEEPNVRSIITKEYLIWNPNCLNNLTEEEFEAYMEFSCSAGVISGGCNKEYALHLLHLCQGNVQNALLGLIDRSNRPAGDRSLTTYGYVDTEAWSADEISQFSSAILKFDKDFFLLQTEVRSKSVKECINFYYLWKKVCPDDYCRLRRIRKKRLADQPYNAYNLRSAVTPASVAACFESNDGTNCENNSFDGDDGTSQDDWKASANSGSNRPETRTMSLVNGRNHVKFRADVAAQRKRRKKSKEQLLRSSAVKPYTCKVCNKSFSRLKSKNAHAKIHALGSSTVAKQQQRTASAAT